METVAATVSSHSILHSFISKPFLLIFIYYYICQYKYTVQASTPSNTYVVSGTVETKQLFELIPQILNQLGPESMDKLRKYAENIQAGQTGATQTIEEEDEDDDDEVPDLVENFEEAAAK